MIENSFPTHDVRAIGRKLDESIESLMAELFPISLIAANFQQDGTVEVDQHNWKKSVIRDGHLLKIWYDT
jgi:hypothetical protein